MRAEHAGLLLLVAAMGAMVAHEMERDKRTKKALLWLSGGVLCALLGVAVLFAVVLGG